MKYNKFFWLHIKKSAGLMTRTMLEPYYIKGKNRVNQPSNFIQSEPIEYNDVVNNFRVVLGEYQFKRCLFAKTYLYPDNWDELFSFAFVREPVDRVISMFFYLFWSDKNMYKTVAESIEGKDIEITINGNISYAFDYFLDLVEQARESNSIYKPIDLHFTTHTAPMWDDVTDLNNQLLLTQVFRLDDLIEGINTVFKNCSINHQVSKSQNKINKNPQRTHFLPSHNQLAKINRLYANDFDLYESVKSLS